MATRENTGNGLEARLRDTANELRGSMDASEYQNVVLGRIFLKYVSDTFAARRDELDAAIRATVKTLLAQRGYPPDYSEAAIEMVLKQTEVFADGWVTTSVGDGAST